MTTDEPVVGERRILRLVGWAGPGEPPAVLPHHPSDEYLVQEWQGERWVDVAKVKGFDAARRLAA